MFTESDEKTQWSWRVSSSRLFTTFVYFCSSGFSMPKNVFVNSRNASFFLSSLSTSIDIFTEFMLEEFTINQLLRFKKFYSVLSAGTFTLYCEYLNSSLFFRFVSFQHFTEAQLEWDWTTFAVFKLLLILKTAYVLLITSLLSRVSFERIPGLCAFFGNPFFSYQSECFWWGNV